MKQLGFLIRSESKYKLVTVAGIRMFLDSQALENQLGSCDADFFVLI